MIAEAKEPFSLSNEELLQNLLALCSKERGISLEILKHLSEVESRELYLSAGFSSLYAYCVDKLRFSESGALRRIRAARLLKQYPELETGLADGSVRVSSLAQLWGTINAENCGVLLGGIKGKTRKETEELIQEFRPRETQIKESIKPIVISTPKAQEVATPLFESAPASIPSKTLHRSWGGGAEPLPTLQYELKCQVSKETKAKLHKVQVLLSGKHPKGLSLEATLDLLLNDYLERHSREGKAERAKKRAERKEQKKTQDLSTGCEESLQHSPQQPVVKSCTTRKPIPVAIKRSVFERDNYCCSFKASDGTECKSTWDLEIDHVQPVAFGGGNEFENLRLLCRGHNAGRVRNATA